MTQPRGTAGGAYQPVVNERDHDAPLPDSDDEDENFMGGPRGELSPSFTAALRDPTLNEGASGFCERNGAEIAKATVFVTGLSYCLNLSPMFGVPLAASVGVASLYASKGVHSYYVSYR